MATTGLPHSRKGEEECWDEDADWDWVHGEGVCVLDV